MTDSGGTTRFGRCVAIFPAVRMGCSRMVCFWGRNNLSFFFSLTFSPAQVWSGIGAENPTYWSEQLAQIYRGHSYIVVTLRLWSQLDCGVISSIIHSIYGLQDAAILHTGHLPPTTALKFGFITYTQCFQFLWIIFAISLNLFLFSFCCSCFDHDFALVVFMGEFKKLSEKCEDLFKKKWPWNYFFNYRSFIHLISVLTLLCMFLKVLKRRSLFLRILIEYGFIFI